MKIGDKIVREIIITDHEGLLASITDRKIVIYDGADVRVSFIEQDYEVVNINEQEQEHE